METDEQEIRKLVETWMEATKAGDTETVLGLMTDDVIFLQPGQQPMLGKSAFAVVAQDQTKHEAPKISGTSEIREIKVLGDWAFMWAKLAVVVTPSSGGSPITRAGYTLSILRKEGGKWLLARDANMLAPVPA